VAPQSSCHTSHVSSLDWGVSGGMELVRSAHGFHDCFRHIEWSRLEAHYMGGMHQY
jgi:hypothetical protein